MAEEISLPLLVVKTAKSEFRLRCHAVAWSREYGGKARVGRRHRRDCPGLLLLSATGPDTAVKSVRASLYQPQLEASFSLEGGAIPRRMLLAKSSFDGKPVAYRAGLARLAPGVIHLVALAKIPGMMPNVSDDHLWAELTGPRYTTPMLRSWIPWLKEAMTRSGGLVLANGFACTVGVLKVEPDELDALVMLGVKEGNLRLVA